MKSVFIQDLLEAPPKNETILLCWIRAKRDHRDRIFLDLVDSTGAIQAVVERSAVKLSIFDTARRVSPESSVRITGRVISCPSETPEVRVTGIKVIAKVTRQRSCRPRALHSTRRSAKTLDLELGRRHLYIRNPHLMKVLRFRHDVLRVLRQWFEDNEFVSIDAPILTPVTLYGDQTAVPVMLHGQHIFLTQCVGYYLEAAVIAFERVYNIGPSFRAAESESPRHLVEYWHLKAELAWSERKEIMHLIENLFAYVLTKLPGLAVGGAATSRQGIDTSQMMPPYEQISYKDAVRRLRKKGFKLRFGQNIQGPVERELAAELARPFWLVGLPASQEPFPYQLDPSDERLTLTADLIAPAPFGELLGVAQKIYVPSVLEKRMRSKGKLANPNYEFIRDVCGFGSVPHAAMGMGIERLIRWLLGLSHVREAIAFPRLIRRSFYP